MYLWLNDRYGRNDVINDQMLIDKTKELGFKLKVTAFSWVVVLVQILISCRQMCMLGNQQVLTTQQ